MPRSTVPRHGRVQRFGSSESPARAPASAPPPIQHYDHLEAADIRDRLTALRDDELDAVESYECTHCNRQRVLEDIEHERGV